MGSLQTICCVLFNDSCLILSGKVCEKCEYLSCWITLLKFILLSSRIRHHSKPDEPLSISPYPTVFHKNLGVIYLHSGAQAQRILEDHQTSPENTRSGARNRHISRPKARILNTMHSPDVPSDVLPGKISSSEWRTLVNPFV